MSSVHLLVLVHGMWGHPVHLGEAKRIMEETRDAKSSKDHRLEILNVEGNVEKTYDGFDWCGERCSEEIMATIERIEKDGTEKVTRFSITGYSLGGLVARYVVGILHQNKFFEKVQPINFNTIATPHIGIPLWKSWFSSLSSTLGPRLLSRSGEQFFSKDVWQGSHTGRSLLQVMADPERIFYQGLAQFEHLVIYGNAVHDITVPYVTACIELTDPFVDYETTGLDVEYEEGYSHLLKSYKIPDVPPQQPKKSRGIMLPPPLTFKFPFNLVVYPLIPLLLPAVFCAAIVRLTLESRTSRSRIKLLESEGTRRQKLMHVLAELEREAEEVVNDMVDGPGSESEDEIPKRYCARRQNSMQAKSDVPPGQPILSKEQKVMVAQLNSLPRLEKRIVYFPGIRNSHATIVARDVKRFSQHEMGFGLLQHWADNLVI